MSYTSEMSHKERFLIESTRKTVYAPSTIGAPGMIHVTDQNEFKKTEEEILELHKMKKELGKTKHHKFVRYAIGNY